jgi:hypothetical protein
MLILLRHGGFDVLTRPLAVAPLSYVEYSATLNAAKAGTYAGLVFDYTSKNDFLFAAIIPGTNQVVLGHVSNGKWTIDATASATINAGTNYTLLVALTEETTNSVNVVLNGKSVLSFTYNYLVHDGGVGLLAKGGAATFDNVLLRGDDVAYAGGGTPDLAAAPANATGAFVTPLTGDELQQIITAAYDSWTAADPSSATALQNVTFAIADLPGQMMGETIGRSIVIDPTAAGYGWFIDPTPAANEEFSRSTPTGELFATSGSAAFGEMDLLTVVMHELGHVLGLEHQTQGVMEAALAPSERLVLTDSGGNGGAAAALAASAAKPQTWVFDELRGEFLGAGTKYYLAENNLRFNFPDSDGAVSSQNDNGSDWLIVTRSHK